MGEAEPLGPPLTRAENLTKNILVMQGPAGSFKPGLFNLFGPMGWTWTMGFLTDQTTQLWQQSNSLFRANAETTALAQLYKPGAKYCWPVTSLSCQQSAVTENPELSSR